MNEQQALSTFLPCGIESRGYMEGSWLCWGDLHRRRGWVFGLPALTQHWSQARPQVRIKPRPHAGGSATCSGCTLIVGLQGRCCSHSQGTAGNGGPERHRTVPRTYPVRAADRGLKARLMGQLGVLLVLVWPLTWPLGFCALQGYVVISSGLLYQR